MQCARCFLERNNQTHRLLDREFPRFEKLDYRLKILRLSISRPENIQFFLHKHPRFIRNRFFGITDVHNPARKGDFFDRSLKGHPCTDSFDHYIWASSFSYFLQTLMQRLTRGVYRVSAPCEPRKFQLLVIHINTDCCCTTRVRCRHGSEPHPATSENCNSVVRSHSSPCDSMKAYGQRFHQAQFLRREFCRI